MTSSFDQSIDRSSTDSFKWQKYSGRDIIPLWVADMDFRSPQPVIDALSERVAHGVFGYTMVPRELIQVIVGRLNTQYGWKVDPEWLVFIPGLVSALYAMPRAVGEPGDEVVTFTPIYHFFLTTPIAAGKRLKTVPLKEAKGQWHIDFAALEKAITKRTKLFMFCNPHNPIGKVYTREELETLAAIAKKHDLTICSDEVFCDLILDKEKIHVPLATIDKETEYRTVTFMSASKTFNLSGLFTSFAIIPNAKLRKRFQEVSEILPWPNLFGYTAMQAAYEQGEEWRQELLEYLRQNRELVYKYIGQTSRLTLNPIEATFLAWIDIRKLKLADPVAFFEKAGVGIMDGKDFGMPGFIRLNFACPQKLLTKALERIVRAVL